MKNWVKNIQAAACNGMRMVYRPLSSSKLVCGCYGLWSNIVGNLSIFWVILRAVFVTIFFQFFGTNYFYMDAIDTFNAVDTFEDCFNSANFMIKVASILSFPIFTKMK